MTGSINDATLDHLCRIMHGDPPDDPRYRVRGAIGEGGMGVVYLADDVALDRPVAMKVLRDSVGPSDAVERMVREARVIARLEHPGIVPVHDMGRLADGRMFYIMKRVKGRRLDEFADKSASMQERLRVFERVCETVAFAHAGGVIHRDLKPQNVMVGEFGEVLVLDWGLAKAVRGFPSVDAAEDDATCAVSTGADRPISTTSGHTAQGTILGTPAYMSPEQARGDVDLVDQRSDVFALGGILYFLLTGDAPTAASKEGPEGAARTPLRHRNHFVPRRLESICLKALASDPRNRYASAAELAEDVARFLNGQAVSAHREGVVERLARWAWWYRVPILIVVAYLLMRAVIILWTRR